MKIQFERTGGVAGLRLIATVHADALAPEEARKLPAMVPEARFFELPATLSHVQPGADRFQYTVTVETRRQLSQEAQRPSVSAPPKCFSVSSVRMLHEALEQGRLSARKAAKAMGLGLGGLTELFAQYDLAAPFDL